MTEIKDFETEIDDFYPVSVGAHADDVFRLKLMVESKNGGKFDTPTHRYTPAHTHTPTHAEGK